MFVVRLKRPNEDFDFKALKSKKAALARFRTAQREMIDGNVEQCALFDAAASDAASAVAIVSQGKARLVASDLSDDPPPAAARKARTDGNRGAAKHKRINRRPAR